MACTVSVPPPPVNWWFSMITATPGTTIRVFGAALAGSVIVRCPAWVIRPWSIREVPDASRALVSNRHEDEASRARSAVCPGSVTTRPGTFDEALAGPAASVIRSVSSSPAASALGRITGEPPE